MSTHGGHILIVDDNELNRRILTRALAEQGHRTTTAENGRQALALLRGEDALPFDVVLLDMLMPELDGYETLRQMKAQPALRNLPVIVISALDEMDSVIRCIELGAEDYLPKPFNPVLLRARLDASLEKKRLRDQEQLYLKGLERELEIGRRIQASFLPNELPQPNGWEIAARFQAARQVAGDFYDAFALNRKQIGLVVADVCDKGVGAALFMALFRSLIRALAVQNFAKPGLCAAKLKATITHTNDYIARTHDRANMFATVFFGALDPATGVLTYINAGHEPPIVFDRAGAKTELTRTGIPVGLMPAMRYRVKKIRLDPGDTLLAFTDGIGDAQNARGEDFTRERLESLVQPSGATVVELLDRIETKVREHIGGANQFDDITMLAMRRAPKRE